MTPRAFVTAESADPSFAPLTPEQSAKLLLDDLPPVSYVDLSRYGTIQPVSGFCPRFPAMPHLGGGEVVIDLGIGQGRMYEAARVKRVAMIYLHELAHRLVPAEAHGAVFAAVCAALNARAHQDEEQGRKGLGWYEVQDAENPGAALNHAIEFGRLHARSAVPAKELAALAQASWSTWRDQAWKDLGAQARAWAQKRIDEGEAEAEQANIAAIAARGSEIAAKAAMGRARRAAAAAVSERTIGWPRIWCLCFCFCAIGVLLGTALR